MKTKHRFQRIAAVAAARAMLRLKGIDPAVAESPAALDALKRSPYQSIWAGESQQQFERDWRTWQKQGRLP